MRAEGVVVTLTDGTTLTLRADINALCDFEAAMHKGGFDPVAALASFETGRRVTLSAVRAMVWACARGARPDLTLTQAGQMLAEDGPALTAAATEALRRAAPDQPEGQGDDAGNRPTPTPPGR